jgi:hypothetical protein
MSERQVFVSVGSTANDVQENFVKAVEDRLRSEGLSPKTVGRTHFSADAPLKAVTDLMNSCAGAVVIALERTSFTEGVDKPGGPKETPLGSVKLATPWNHIEAAMAYTRNLPLLVIVQDGVKKEGLLEEGYDWYVQSVKPDAAALSTNEFNGILSSWKGKLDAKPQRAEKALAPEELTIGTLIGAMKPAQLWSLLGVLAGSLSAAFVLGAKLFGG